MTANIRSIVEAIDELPVVDQQILAGVFAPSHGEPNIPGVNRRRVPELFSQITNDDVAEAVRAALIEYDVDFDEAWNVVANDCGGDHAVACVALDEMNTRDKLTPDALLATAAHLVNKALELAPRLFDKGKAVEDLLCEMIASSGVKST